MSYLRLIGATALILSVYSQTFLQEFILIIYSMLEQIISNEFANLGAVVAGAGDSIVRNETEFRRSHTEHLSFLDEQDST